jgi:hypothetical protein
MLIHKVKPSEKPDFGRGELTITDTDFGGSGNLDLVEESQGVTAAGIPTVEEIGCVGGRRLWARSVRRLRSGKVSVPR